MCVRFVRTARTTVSAQHTGWIHRPGSLRANMSRLLRRVLQREGYASSANQTTCGSPRRGSTKTGRVCWLQTSLWCRPELLTKNTRPPDCPSKKRLLKQLRVRLRHLIVGRLRRRLGGEPWKPAKSQPMLCRRRNGRLLKIVHDFDMQVHHHHARRQFGVGSGWVVSRLPPGDGKGCCRDR